MAMTLSSCSTPSIDLYFPGIVLARFSFFARVLYRISLTSELFPDPDTPVTQVITPRGNATWISVSYTHLDVYKRQRSLWAL